MSTTNSNPTNLFPTIGRIAEKADKSTTDGTDQSVSTTEAPEAEQEEKVVEEIESLCMRCHEQGVTRMLLTSIPFFREIIVMSFRCEHCGWQNNEVQSAGSIRRTFFCSVSPVKQTTHHRAQLKAQFILLEFCPVRTLIARLSVLRPARFLYPS